MVYFSEPALAPPVECPYLEGKSFVQEYFYAAELTTEDLGRRIRAGWRRFGAFFFRPQCHSCRACEPLRLPVDRLMPSEAQLRVIRKNKKTRVVVRDLVYREEIFEVYADHSLHRFGKVADMAEFRETFFFPSAPALQIEYWIDEQLAGVGFVDVGDQELSSVYYIYRDKFKAFSLGTYSVFHEASLAQKLGRAFYNLGFWVRDNERMRYKGNFAPREIMDWGTFAWTEG